jgi:betaine-aldehyde dehydrogenase
LSISGLDREPKGAVILDETREMSDTSTIRHYSLEAINPLPFIDGAFIKPREHVTMAIIDPSTNSSIAQVAMAGQDEVHRAASAARIAFEDGPWRRMPAFERGQVLHRIADRITDMAEPLAHIEALNGGKPISAARREVAGAARVFRYYSGAMDKYFGETIPLSEHLLDFTLREPLGVVAQVVPWNFPFLAAAWKLAPAMAAGCAAILKPAPATPLSALVLAEICRDVEVPPGIVNVLPGGSDVGRQLIEHGAIDGISFTGSTAVGAAVMRSAAEKIKRLTLELGGKSANVIFADADLEKAASSAVSAAFGNAGQSCSARTRLLVEKCIEFEFIEAFKAATTALRAGPPLEETTTLGPLISQVHWRRVHGFVEGGLSAGARLLQGGDRPAGFHEGNFFEPTILGNVKPDMVVAQDEVFGPVCAVMTFETEEEALHVANDTKYGLNGSVWTRDLGRALRMVRGMRTGTIAVNGLPSASLYGVFAPFGGYKQSGLGRELGMHALSFYTEIKNVVIDLSG